MTIQFQGRIGRRAVTIRGENPLTDEQAREIYQGVRGQVHPGGPVEVDGYAITVRRVVRGPRVQP